MVDLKIMLEQQVIMLIEFYGNIYMVINYYIYLTIWNIIKYEILKKLLYMLLNY